MVEDELGDEDFKRGMRYLGGFVPSREYYEEERLINIHYEGCVPIGEDYADYYVPRRTIKGSVLA